MIDIFQYVTLEQLAFVGIVSSIVGITAGIIISTRPANLKPSKDKKSAENKDEANS